MSRSPRSAWSSTPVIIESITPRRILVTSSRSSSSSDASSSSRMRSTWLTGLSLKLMSNAASSWVSSRSCRVGACSMRSMIASGIGGVLGRGKSCVCRRVYLIVCNFRWVIPYPVWISHSAVAGLVLLTAFRMISSRNFFQWMALNCSLLDGFFFRYVHRCWTASNERP